MGSYLSERQNTKIDQAILFRIARADKSAALECVEVYGKMIWALAKKHTDSVAEAERIVPEIFMDIWKHARFCNLEISDEANWIALIALRCLSNHSTENNYQSPPEIPLEVLTVEYGKIQKTMVGIHHFVAG